MHNSEPPGSDLVKVTFEFEPGAWHGHGAETMWAERLSDSTCLLRSVPFYAYDLSYDDVVTVKPIDNALVITGIARRGGHSTYRIFLSRELTDEGFRTAWLSLERLGCTYERATKHLLAIDVAPDADIAEIYQRLEQGETDGKWHFEEGHCGHRLRRS